MSTLWLGILNVLLVLVLLVVLTHRPATATPELPLPTRSIPMSPLGPTPGPAPRRQ